MPMQQGQRPRDRRQGPAVSSFKASFDWARNAEQLLQQPQVPSVAAGDNLCGKPRHLGGGRPLFRRRVPWWKTPGATSPKSEARDSAENPAFELSILT